MIPEGPMTAGECLDKSRTLGDQIQKLIEERNDWIELARVKINVLSQELANKKREHELRASLNN